LEYKTGLRNLLRASLDILSKEDPWEGSGKADKKGIHVRFDVLVAFWWWRSSSSEET
jgi:hypothetical protein